MHMMAFKIGDQVIQFGVDIYTLEPKFELEPWFKAQYFHYWLKRTIADISKDIMLMKKISSDGGEVKVFDSLDDLFEELMK